MKTIANIKESFPVVFEILGAEYIESLKIEQGALSQRATINPFFKILYVEDEMDIEG